LMLDTNNTEVIYPNDYIQAAIEFTRSGDGLNKRLEVPFALGSRSDFFGCVTKVSLIVVKISV
jgi:hypothetical protein